MSILKHRRELWLASALALALTGTAGAADLAAMAPVVAPAPVFTWTGCYLGAHAGGGVMSDSYVYYPSGFANGSAHGGFGGDFEGGFGGDSYDGGFDGGFGGRFEGRFGYDYDQRQYGPADNNLWRSAGAVAGGQIGCNYQFGNFVVELEAEYSWSGIKSKFEEADADYHAVDQFKNKSDWDVAIRLGYAIDRLLIYSKVGWAWGKFDASYAETGEDYSYQNSASKTLNGFLLGVGTEYALAQNWTIKAEYNFVAYQAGAFNFAESGTDCSDECYSWTDSYTDGVIGVSAVE
jgi:outer membrane immunogenic protein